MKRSKEKYREQIEKLKKELAQADAVVIGAGAGLSTAAGFEYTGERFKKYFFDFEAKYGFHDMYSGGFYPYPEPEGHWAYWSRYICINRYMDAPRPVCHKHRLFCTQGDYGLFQCSRPCHRKAYHMKWRFRQTLFRVARSAGSP